MIGMMRRAGLLGLALALIAAPAWATVTLTFYAHPGARFRGGELLFPHAYVHASGSLDDTGDPVDWAAGSRPGIPVPTCCSRPAPASSPRPRPAMWGRADPICE